MIRKLSVVVVAALAALTACSQGSHADPGSAATAGAEAAVAATVAGQAGKPALYDHGEIDIAVVRQLNAGDVYEAWISGVKAEATKLHAKLTIFDADGDNAKQALYLQQAVAAKPDAILVGWGFADTLKPGLQAAQAAGIPVVTYYVQVPPSDAIATVDQGDQVMMQGILDKMKTDQGASAKVIYVYVPGYQALDLRNETWKKFSQQNSGIQNVATIGVVASNTAPQVADQAKAALTAHPDVTAIVAPYDEFAKGATLAVQELGLQDKVKVYGMDISTADIGVMTQPGSPWVVTATTDQSNVGAVALRTTVVKAAKDLQGNSVVVPPQVISQTDLRSKSIQNVDQLATAFPGLRTPDLMRAPWMENLG